MSCFKGKSVATMGLVGATTSIFLVLLTTNGASANLLGGEDESQGMVGMIKKEKSILELQLEMIKDKHPFRFCLFSHAALF